MQPGEGKLPNDGRQAPRRWRQRLRNHGPVAFRVHVAAPGPVPGQSGSCGRKGHDPCSPACRITARWVRHDARLRVRNDRESHTGERRDAGRE